MTSERKKFTISTDHDEFSLEQEKLNGALTTWRLSNHGDFIDLCAESLEDLAALIERAIREPMAGYREYLIESVKVEHVRDGK